MIEDVKNLGYNFIKYYDLLIALLLRDIKIKYKRSILGFAWSILNPLLMMIVMSIVFSTIFKTDIKNFPMYLITGQVIFTFFSEATNMAMMSIIGNGGLIKKVYIPKYIFPLSKVMFSFTNMLFSLIAVVIVAIATKLPITPAILLFPLPLIYVFIFSFFSEATNTAMTSIISNGGLIKKVYIPKYIFALSKVMFSFTNMLFSLVAVVIVAIATKLPITPAILLFPLPLIYVFIFSLGVGLLLASYAVFFRDLLHLYGIILLVWTYLTPIFYPITILPENIRKILIYNPMYVYIDNFREIVLYGRVPSLQSNLLCIVYAIIALIIGTLAFKSVKDKFIFYI